MQVGLESRSFGMRVVPLMTQGTRLEQVHALSDPIPYLPHRAKLYGFPPGRYLPDCGLRNQETNTGRDEASADLYSRVTDVHEHEDAHNGAHDSGNETHYWIASFPPG